MKSPQREDLEKKAATWMKSIGWIEHDNFWSLASDEWAKTTMSKKAALVMYQTQKDTITRVLGLLGDNEGHKPGRTVAQDAYQQGADSIRNKVRKPLTKELENLDA